jgi:parvulin-like peptidyl-prolyl isomerase
MLPANHLPADLVEAVAGISRQPIAELLLQRGILRQLASDLLLQRLRDSVTFTAEEEPLVLTRLWDGVPGDPPASLRGDWIASLPELIQGPLQDRWNQIRQQKWIENTYQERLEPYFLERRTDLEQVVYGMIRLRNQGAAEELYLRLLDDDADFGSLARTHSLGEERYTRGLVGPMLINQPHATIRAVLDKLTVGEVHPPFRVENWVLLVQMEHRLPASLTDATRMQLYNELFQRDLEATLDQQLQAIYTSLLPAPALPPEAPPAAVLGSQEALPMPAPVPSQGAVVTPVPAPVEASVPTPHTVSTQASHGDQQLVPAQTAEPARQPEPAPTTVSTEPAASMQAPVPTPTAVVTPPMASAPTAEPQPQPQPVSPAEPATPPEAAGLTKAEAVLEPVPSSLPVPDQDPWSPSVPMSERDPERKPVPVPEHQPEPAAAAVSSQGAVPAPPAVSHQAAVAAPQPEAAPSAVAVPSVVAAPSAVTATSVKPAAETS